MREFRNSVPHIYTQGIEEFPKSSNEYKSTEMNELKKPGFQLEIENSLKLNKLQLEATKPQRSIDSLKIPNSLDLKQIKTVKF